MVKKYEITSDCKTVDGVKVCRIKALRDIRPSFYEVKKGDLGGYVEKEDNLSHIYGAWVGNDAVVKGNARVYDNAVVSGEAVVEGNARVYDNAWIKDHAVVEDDAVVSGNAHVSDEAVVTGESWISDNAWVFGNAVVEGESVVECDTRLKDSVKVSNSRVCATYYITFDSQEKFDDYLKGYTSLVEKFER